MNSNLKELIDQAIQLIQQKNYTEAELKLLSARKDYYENSSLNFLLGRIYADWESPLKSQEKAIHYFQLVIDSDLPIERAFIELIYLVRERNKQISILKRGLSAFPQSSDIFEMLINRLEYADRLVVFDSISDHSFINETTLFTILISLYELDLFERVIQQSLEMQNVGKDFALLKDLIVGFAYLKLGDPKQAEGYFTNLKQTDIKQVLNYGPTIGLIACSMSNKSIDSWTLLSEIPFDTSFFPNTGENLIPLCLSFENLFLEILNYLETQTTDKILIGRIRGLRGIYYFRENQESTPNHAISDLKYSHKMLPAAKAVCSALCKIYAYKNNHLDAFKYFCKYVKNLGYNDLNSDEIDYESNFIDQASKEDFEKIVLDFNSFVKDSSNSIKSFLVKTLLNDIIGRLYSDKKYMNIISIIEPFSQSHLFKSDILFDIAYSFAEINEELKAKLFYEKYIESNKQSNPALNNLALIYEHQGDLEKAKELLQKAIQIDPEDKTAQRNFDRVSTNLESFLKACESLSKENIWIKNRLHSFLKYENAKGLIACSYAQLPKYLSTSAQKASELIKTFLSKNYIYRIEKHGLDTNSAVYAFNPYISRQIKDISAEFEKESELISLAELLNSESLDLIGYNSKLSDSLTKVSDIDLRLMLQRDLRENALSLIIKNYKSVLIISGSIIEALILEKLISKGLSSYILQNGKNIKLLDMALNDLLYVANKEKVINDQLYHLSHALRGFRNLIHPGVEQRKKALEISETNAKLAWDITRKIILEI
jgi:tetratricopeptide (TPR) repeat protein